MAKDVTKKVVRIKENALVDLIDNIVNEAVALKKQEWLNEQASKNDSKTSLLESKIANLEAQFKKLATTKKA